MACRRCLRIRWFLMIAGPLLALGLLAPVQTATALSRLPDLRALTLWFPAVILATFAWRWISWRRVAPVPARPPRQP